MIRRRPSLTSRAIDFMSNLIYYRRKGYSLRASIDLAQRTI